MAEQYLTLKSLNTSQVHVTHKSRVMYTLTIFVRHNYNVRHSIAKHTRKYQVNSWRAKNIKGIYLECNINHLTYYQVDRSNI